MKFPKYENDKKVLKFIGTWFGILIIAKLFLLATEELLLLF